ncbi:MAG: M48 family metallopeptidase [Xanthomonadales bacterium]|nr:M48 family metallopeptidase [Xanthomonadales bacterium]
MNFFLHQERARRQTRRMLVLFALAVVVIVVATDFVLLLALAGTAAFAVGPGGLALLSLFVLLVIGSGSLYRIATLRGGGAAVARGLGGVPVPTDSTHFAYRRLRNVVEELAIASGVPVPDVFVLEEEAGINAFASGYAPADAAITVTRGALDKLTREELQGVIGHEFSHVLNGDMRLNIRLMGVVFGILVMSVVGRRIAQASGRGRGRNSGGIVLLGFGLFAVGYIGVIFTRLIKASISRHREFLADASAVQFTRQTEGIGGALKKIAALAEGSRLAASDTEEVSHMLFSDGLARSALFATHPPLHARILKLDPAFRPGQLEAIAAAWAAPVAAADPEAAGASIAGFAPAIPAAGAAEGGAIPAAGAQVRLSPRSVARQVGNPGVDDRVAAQGLHASLPVALREAAGHSDQAMPLVFALLLSAEPDVRTHQLARIAGQFDAALEARTARVASLLQGLHPMQRLPLAALAFPALRRRPRPQLTGFMIAVRALIEADRRVTLDEYCLATLLRIQVMEALDPGAARRIGREKLPGVERELRDLLAILARHGHGDAEAARQAYVRGLREVLPGAALEYRPPADWALALDRALPRLDLLAPAGKELVVQAMTAAISADGLVSVAEAELLRTVCAALHCPLPPLLQDAA